MQQELTLTVLTTGATRYVVLAEKVIEDKECVAVVEERDFEQGLESLQAGGEHSGGPTFRWMERRGDELLPLPANLAVELSRQVAAELTRWLERGDEPVMAGQEA